jgi:hypothetical protein
MSSVFAVTTSDSVDLAQPVGKLWVGGTGDLAVAFANIFNGSATGSIVLKAVPAGWYTLPDSERITRIYATGTTATNLVAFA